MEAGSVCFTLDCHALWLSGRRLSLRFLGLSRNVEVGHAELAVDTSVFKRHIHTCRTTECGRAEVGQ